MKYLFEILSFILLLHMLLFAQPWQQNDAIFNPSGVPSLMFSHPRFTDLDEDGDFDMILGNMSDKPLYLENIGTESTPKFQVGSGDIFSLVSSLDAEAGVMADINGDGKTDFITGGYTGLHLYKNAGIPEFPIFVKEEGYFSGIHAGSYPVPDLGDVDDDGDLDLVLGFSEDGSVKIYFNTGTDSVAQFSDNNTLFIGDVGLYAYPVFCDIDTDGDLDLLIGRDGHGFAFYRNNGNAANGTWYPDAIPFNGIGSDTYFNSPGVADLNGDGKLDLVYGSGSGPLNYFQNTGTAQTPVWTRNTTLFGGTLDVGGASNPVFYDYDFDGDQDLFSGSNLGDIKYYENTGTAHSPAWKEKSSSFSGLKHSIYASVAIGDVNQDSLPDAIVGDLSGHLYFHKNTGSGFIFQSDVLSHISLGGWSVPRLVDMDDDADLDLVAGNEDGNLFYFENQGTPDNPDWVEIVDYFKGIDVGSNCVPSVSDFTGNGRLDVLTGNMWRELHFFTFQDSMWKEDTTFFAGIVGGQNMSPALIDMDCDGDQDLVLGCYEGTFSYYENLAGTTNLTDQHIILPDDIGLKNYPNPFNASTTIEFVLSMATPASLAIFDLRGREVRSWRFSKLSQGVHALNWDGCKQDGSPVGSGVYIYQIRTPVHVSSKKMILLK